VAAFEGLSSMKLVKNKYMLNVLLYIDMETWTFAQREEHKMWMSESKMDLTERK
jgi:hypothetical protein